MQNPKLGWIGMGRMGYPMAERLVKAGYDVSIWNRTRAKAEPLADLGAKLVDSPRDLSSCDIIFTMVSTGNDVEMVYFGESGVLSGDKTPAIFVDCSSIGVDQSAEVRARLKERGAELIAAPVSGNSKCVKAGKLSAVASGPQTTFAIVERLIATMASRGVSYVGEGELARFCKIAHNVFLGVVTQNLAEITVLCQKAGVSRRAFLEFINNSVMGSIFTQYKANAFVNLDWTTTFTPALLRKDLDLGLSTARALDVPMPVAAAAREAYQSHFGAIALSDDPEGGKAADFAAVLETVAAASGVKLQPEGKLVPTGLELPAASEH